MMEGSLGLLFEGFSPLLFRGTSGKVMGFSLKGCAGCAEEDEKVLSSFMASSCQCLLQEVKMGAAGKAMIA